MEARPAGFGELLPCNAVQDIPAPITVEYFLYGLPAEVAHHLFEMEVRAADIGSSVRRHEQGIPQSRQQAACTGTP